MDGSRQQGILEYATGQQGGPEDPGAIPQGWSNNGGREAGIKEEGQNSFPSHTVKALHVAHPAADDDHIRIQDVDHVGQRLAHARLLRGTGMAVAEVARRTGYRSPSALTAALRRTHHP